MKLINQSRAARKAAKAHARRRYIPPMLDRSSDCVSRSVKAKNLAARQAKQEQFQQRIQSNRKG